MRQRRSTARPHHRVTLDSNKKKYNATFRLRWVELAESFLKVFPTRADALAARKREARKIRRPRASCVSHDAESLFG